MIIYFKEFINEKYKTLKISKILLDSVCSDFNLDHSKLKFLDSGFFGNAYEIDDKVLKITSDIREVNDVYKIVGKKLPGVVKYYKIKKIENSQYYAILMDKVITLEDYIKKYNDIKKVKKFINHILNNLYYNWNDINNFDYFKKLVLYEISEEKYMNWFLLKFWNFYKKLKFLDNFPDINFYNIGIDKKNELIFFDYNKSKNIKKL